MVISVCVCVCVCVCMYVTYALKKNIYIYLQSNFIYLLGLFRGLLKK